MTDIERHLTSLIHRLDYLEALDASVGTRPHRRVEIESHAWALYELAKHHREAMARAEVFAEEWRASKIAKGQWPEKPDV